MPTSEESTTPHYKDTFPVIDLSLPEEDLIPQIAHACSTFGFFQIINHEHQSIANFQSAMVDYFALPREIKLSYKRRDDNARGYFDDELTRQKRDWKECLDVGVPGSRDWSRADDDAENACLDGWNQFPSVEELPRFRATVVSYFEECAELSLFLFRLMARGMESIDHNNNESFFQELKHGHASYLRMNYYPPCSHDDQLQNGNGRQTTATNSGHYKEGDDGTKPILGVSPHRDASFLTILLQDEDCHSLQVWHESKWKTIHPVPNALTVNTGDMCMLWSNGKYQAPLHRVLTNESSKRYSSPFFYNPPYTMLIHAPLLRLDPEDKEIENHKKTHKYHPLLYGYFRAVRFAGDVTDLGIEIQTSDYLIDQKSPSSHLRKQEFMRDVDFFKTPFSIEKYRSFLIGKDQSI
mmetsp:Transcript_18816/g.28418  ORF Transcript_18816/g.28418 Transcript_18816/m.28418 type:complete len:409 (-) Transcript_18816:177-1403(-)